MPRLVLNVGSQMRLRYRIFPRHPQMKAADHSMCMVDLPAGSLAVVLRTQGSDMELAVFTGGGGPKPGTPIHALPAVQRTDIIVPLHMVDQYFVA